MKKLRVYFVAFLVFATVSISGCSTSLLEDVKSGTLGDDPTRTIGNVFDSYQYFSSIEWKENKDAKGRSVARFTGDVTNDLRSYLGNVLVLASGIGLKDAKAFIDLIKYAGAWNSSIRISEQIDINKTESDRVKSVENSKRRLSIFFVVDFAKSLDSKKIIVVDKKIVLKDKETGIEEKIECSNAAASAIMLSYVYGGTPPDEKIFRCVLNHKIVPIEDMPEYPEDVNVLRRMDKKKP